MDVPAPKIPTRRIDGAAGPIFRSAPMQAAQRTGATAALQLFKVSSINQRKVVIQNVTQTPLAQATNESFPTIEPKVYASDTSSPPTTTQSIAPLPPNTLVTPTPTPKLKKKNGTESENMNVFHGKTVFDLWQEVDEAFSTDSARGEFLSTLLEENKKGCLGYVQSSSHYDAMAMAMAMAKAQTSTMPMEVGRKKQRRVHRETNMIQRISLPPPVPLHVIKENDFAASEVGYALALAGSIDERVINLLRGCSAKETGLRRDIEGEYGTGTAPLPFMSSGHGSPLVPAQLSRSTSSSSAATTSSIDSEIDILLKRECASMTPLLELRKLEKVSQRPAFRLLGKRGRKYSEVWEEEKFLSKMGLKCAPLTDWADLIYNYHDDFDGSYRELMIKLTGHKKYFSKMGDLESNKKDNHFPTKLIPPLVPSSCHHPAAWGPRVRLSQHKTSSCIADENPLKSGTFDYSQVHPACNSDTILLPLEIAGCEDIDVLNIECQEAENELERLEAMNFFRLAKLKRSYDIAIKIEKMKKTRDRLQDLLCSVYSAISRRLVSCYSKKCDWTKAVAIADKKEPTGAGRTSLRAVRESSRMFDDFIIGNGTTSDDKKRPLIDLFRAELGSCMISNVSHGEFVSRLSLSDIIEVKFNEGWRLCKVLDLRHDGSILRHIKVLPLNGSPFFPDWICADDGRISPPRNNLPSGFVDMVLS